jgi:4-oxalomesaconate hydratase
MIDKQVRLLVFSAHAADFCSRAGGTIALYTSRGSTVHVVDLSYGEVGESGGYWAREGLKSIEEAKRVRAAEAEEAASILGGTIEFLDYGDYPLMIDQLRLEQLAKLIRRRRPDIILTHWKQDPFNIDHEVTTLAVLRAAGIAAIPGFDHTGDAVHPYPYAFGYEPTVPRNEAAGFFPDHYVAIEDVFDVKMKALRALRSQGFLEKFYTQWAEYRALQATQSSRKPVKYAEAFQRFVATVDTRLPEPGR